jgi:pilin isopeptide linkage protein
MMQRRAVPLRWLLVVLACALALCAAIGGTSASKAYAQEFTITQYPSGYSLYTVNDGEPNPVVYCLNEHRNPAEDTGTSGFAKTENANASYSENVIKALHYGYPNNLGGWYEMVPDSYSGMDKEQLARTITQQVIYRYTDNDTEFNWVELYDAYSALAQVVESGSVPENANLIVYHRDDAYQDFARLTTASSTTYANVTVEKHWELDGAAFSGQHPAVTFKLYAGEGTSGTLLGTKSIEAGTGDGSVTFEGVDTTTVKKFTVVEELGASTLGSYTFAAADDHTVDLTGVSDGQAFTDTVTNTVSEEESVSVNLKVSKSWKLGDTDYAGDKPSVTFRLYAGTDTSVDPLDTKTLAAGDSSVTFESIDTTTVKNFTLVETLGSTQIGSYAFAPAANQAVDLTDITDGDTASVTVTNTVTEQLPSDVSVSLVASKKLDGAAPAAGQFSFLLCDTDTIASGQEAIQTKSNDADGKVTFDPISYSLTSLANGDGTYASAKTFSYSISEVIPDGAVYSEADQTYTKDGIVYDGHVEHVTVTLSYDAATNALSVSDPVYDDDGAAFANATVASETVSIPVEKKWAGGASGESATIVLTSNGQPTDKTLELTEANEWKGSFDNLPKYDEQGNEIEYGVSESSADWNYTVAPDGNGGFIVTNSPKSATAEASVSIAALKTLDGAQPGDKVYSFALRDASGNVLQTKTNGADGSISFDPLVFTEAGTYTYAISEVNDGQSGISYDLSVYTATVTVSADGNNGLTASLAFSKGGSGVGAVTFNNRTMPQQESINIPVAKKWAAGASGESATIVLIRNGQLTDQKLVLTQANGWKGNFSGLPKYDGNGKAYTYGIVEETSQWAYTVESDGAGGYIVTNHVKTADIPQTGDETSGLGALVATVLGATAILAGAGIAIGRKRGNRA